MPLSVLSVFSRLSRIQSKGWIHIAKAAIARKYLRNTLLNRVVLAVPTYIAILGAHHRAPWAVLEGPANTNVEAQCRCWNRDRKHQPHVDFHRAFPRFLKQLILSPPYCALTHIKMLNPVTSEMSAIGPKQTLAGAPHMSAFGRKADMTACNTHVRFRGRGHHVLQRICLLLTQSRHALGTS